jgi:hypothetical protein
MFEQFGKRPYFHVNYALRRLPDSLPFVFHQVVFGYLVQPHVEPLSPLKARRTALCDECKGMLNFNQDCITHLRHVHQVKI